MKNSFHYQLMVTHSVFRRKVLAEIAGVCPELLPGQPKVIDFLMEKPSAIQHEIAEACVIEPPTLTNILAKMETAGLIERCRNDENRRNVIVSLTRQGLEAGEKVRKAFAGVEARALTGLSQTEVGDLVLLLKKIQNHLLEENTNGQA